MQTVTEYRLDFCTIHHRDDGIAIIEIKDGINLSAEMAQELADLTKKVYGDRPLALLSNRKNSFSFSFDALTTLAELPNLVALAIVIYNQQTRILVETQNFFLSAMRAIPIKIFTDLDNAEEWLKEIMEQHLIDEA